MSRAQVQLLLNCIRLYLNYQWTKVIPSPERNNVIRVLQVLKGRLLPLLEPSNALERFVFTAEEGAEAKAMLDNLIPSTRSAGLPLQVEPANLLALRNIIERTSRM